MCVEKADEAIEKMRFEIPVKTAIEILFERYVWFTLLLSMKCFTKIFFDILKYFYLIDFIKGF